MKLYVCYVCTHRYTVSRLDGDTIWLMIPIFFAKEQRKQLCKTMPKFEPPIMWCSQRRHCIKPCENGIINNVLLGKMEGPVWHTIYHLPVVKGVNNPLYY